MIEFTVYGKPVPKGSTRPWAVMKDGEPVLKNGRPVVVTTGDNKGTKNWQRLIAATAQRYVSEKIYDGAVSLEVEFYFMRPASVSEKKRPFPTVKPDLDKLVRSVGDALKGVIYTEDARIVRLIASKDYGDRPQVVIRVSGVGEEIPENGQGMLFD